MLKIKSITPKIKCKTVNYFGFEILVPTWTNYVAFDVDYQGQLTLIAFEIEPEFDEEEQIWYVPDSAYLTYLMYNVEYEGSFRDSLQKVDG